MAEPTQSVEVFDGNTLSPEFALAIKQFFAKLTATGTVQIAGHATNQAVPHGLAGTPNFISLSPFNYYDSTNGLSGGFLGTKAPDSVNFYVTNNGGLTRSAVWYATIL